MDKPVDIMRSYLILNLQGCKDNYEEKDKKIIKISDIYDKFRNDIFFSTLTKVEKRKYNNTYFKNYIQENVFLQNYYVERAGNIRNVIQGWQEKTNEDE